MSDRRLARLKRSGVVIPVLPSWLGESVPSEKRAGDTVIGATVNQMGTIFVRVDKLGADSMLAQIVRLVEDAQTNKAPIQAVADRVCEGLTDSDSMMRNGQYSLFSQISSVFVPAVLVIATVAFTIWLALAYTVLPDNYFPIGTGES